MGKNVRMFQWNLVRIMNINYDYAAKSMKDVYKNTKLNLSKDWFEKPESLKYEEFDCTKVQENFNDDFEDR